MNILYIPTSDMQRMIWKNKITLKYPQKKKKSLKGKKRKSQKLSSIVMKIYIHGHLSLKTQGYQLTFLLLSILSVEAVQI